MSQQDLKMIINVVFKFHKKSYQHHITGTLYFNKLNCSTYTNGTHSVCIQYKMIIT